MFCLNFGTEDFQDIQLCLDVPCARDCKGFQLISVERC